MAPTHTRSLSASAVPASNSKCDAVVKKKFTCSFSGCGKCFSRSEHLHRHALNHKDGDSTCLRCMAHFHRRDLLDRHLARHKEKDDEAGGEGLGVLATRKRLWRDPEGKIVNTRRPSCAQDTAKRRQIRRSVKKVSNHIETVDNRRSISLPSPVIDGCVLGLLNEQKTEELPQNTWRDMAALPSPPTSEVGLETIRPNSRDTMSDNLETLYDESWPVVTHDLPHIFNTRPEIERSPEYSPDPVWANQQFQTFMGSIGETPSDDIFRLDMGLYGWQTWNNHSQATMSRCRDQKVENLDERRRQWQSNSTQDVVFRRGFGLSTC